MLDASKITSSIGDFQRNYLWKIDIISYPALVDTIYPGAKQFVQNIDLVATTGEIPDNSQKDIKIEWAGWFGWWSGPTAMTGETVVGLRSSRDYGAIDFFEAWKSTSGNSTNGAANPKPLTLGAVKFSLVDVDKTTVLKAYVLDMLQIGKVDAQKLDKKGAEIVEFNVTMKWERRFKIDTGLGNV